MALETLVEVHQPASREISVLIATDEEIRDLNRQWRNLDEATDVLSWPGGNFPGAILGDIAIGLETAQKQAAAHAIPLEEELALLAIHGGLHLLGFDDLTENDRETMLVKMQEVAHAANIPMDANWSSIPHDQEAHGGRA